MEANASRQTAHLLAVAGDICAAGSSRRSLLVSLLLIVPAHRPARAGHSSRHRGVSLRKASGRWGAEIIVDGKTRHFGSFAGEEETAAAYREAAATIAQGDALPIRPARAGPSSQYRGLCWHKPSGKWRARIRIGGQQQYLSSFAADEEAAAAYREAASVIAQTGASHCPPVQHRRSRARCTKACVGPRETANGWPGSWSAGSRGTSVISLTRRGALRPTGRRRRRHRAAHCPPAQHGRGTRRVARFSRSVPLEDKRLTGSSGPGSCQGVVQGGGASSGKA